MKNSKDEVIEIYNRLGNFSYKIEKLFHMPYQFVTLIFCILFYILGFLIAIFVDNYHNFFSSWAVILGSIDLYLAIASLMWFEKEFFTIMTTKIRPSFDVNDSEYFKNLKTFLLESYSLKNSIISGILLFLWALYVVISFMQGTREHFLPGFNSSLITSSIFMAYIVLWAAIVSFFIGVAVHAFIISFKLTSIMKRFRIVFNLSHPDGMFGFKPFSNFLLKGIFIYYFGTLLFIVWLNSDFNFGGYLLVGSISLIGIGLYFIPLIGIHKAIESTKNEILNDIDLTIDATVIRNSLLNDFKITKLHTLIIITKEILKINTWLLNWKVILQITTSSLIPTVFTLIKQFFHA